MEQRELSGFVNRIFKLIKVVGVSIQTICLPEIYG
jgi:hypothetical protein